MQRSWLEDFLTVAGILAIGVLVTVGFVYSMEHFFPSCPKAVTADKEPIISPGWSCVFPNPTKDYPQTLILPEGSRPPLSENEVNLIRKAVDKSFSTIAFDFMDGTSKCGYRVTKEPQGVTKCWSPIFITRWVDAKYKLEKDGIIEQRVYHFVILDGTVSFYWEPVKD